MNRAYERDQNLKKLGPKSTSLKSFVGRKLRPLIDLDKVDATDEGYSNPFSLTRKISAEQLVTNLGNLKHAPEMGKLGLKSTQMLIKPLISSGPGDGIFGLIGKLKKK
jgi:hypothetical protein